MLIEVLEDVLNKALNQKDSDNETAVETIRHLLWSLRKNRHLVFFPSLDTVIMEKLRSILSDIEIDAIRHTYSKKQDLNQIKKILTCRIEVSFSHVQGVDGHVIKINPGKDNLLELYEECHLLTENLMDAEFYNYLVQSYQKQKGIYEGLFRVNYYPIQGGGAATKQVYLYECEKRQHLCLAILDSDKKWPNYNGYGDTATTFEKAYNQFVKEKGIPSFCNYYIMQGTSEIENLIPICVLKVFSNAKQKAFLNKYSSALQWFDMKKGLDYRSLYRKEAYDEWKKVFPTEINWAVIDSVKKKCQDSDGYNEQIQNQGLPPVVEPWGSTILESVLHPNKKNRIRYSLKTISGSQLTPSQKKEWSAIGELIFNWCCCFTRSMI